MSAFGTKQTSRSCRSMSAFGGKADIVESHNAPTALLGFGSPALAPSKECGRCSLAKLGLAQFTAGLFWGFGEQWHLAVDIFDALPPHTVAASYMRPIHTRHNVFTLNMRANSKAAGKMSKTGGLAVAPQTMPPFGRKQHRRGCRTGSHGESAVRPRKHTRTHRGLVQIG